MKEATGEANMTIITVALIAIISAVGIPLIKSMIDNADYSSRCQNAGYIWENNSCKDGNGTKVTKDQLKSENQ